MWNVSRMELFRLYSCPPSLVKTTVDAFPCSTTLSSTASTFHQQKTVPSQAKINPMASSGLDMAGKFRVRRAARRHKLPTELLESDSDAVTMHDFRGSFMEDYKHVIVGNCVDQLSLVNKCIQMHVLYITHHKDS